MNWGSAPLLLASYQLNDFQLWQNHLFFQDAMQPHLQLQGKEHMGGKTSKERSQCCFAAMPMGAKEWVISLLASTRDKDASKTNSLPCTYNTLQRWGWQPPFLQPIPTMGSLPSCDEYEGTIGFAPLLCISNIPLSLQTLSSHLCLPTLKVRCRFWTGESYDLWKATTEEWWCHTSPSDWKTWRKLNWPQWIY